MQILQKSAFRRELRLYEKKARKLHIAIAALNRKEKNTKWSQFFLIHGKSLRVCKYFSPRRTTHSLTVDDFEDVVFFLFYSDKLLK